MRFEKVEKLIKKMEKTLGDHGAILETKVSYEELNDIQALVLALPTKV